jgi:hypothetical protein
VEFRRAHLLEKQGLLRRQYMEEIEELTEDEMWDSVMFDWFPNAQSEDEIAEELDNMWND